MRIPHGGMAIALLAALAGGACNTLLEVDIPGAVPVETLDDPGLAPMMVKT